ncbi:MAG: hypothetical protein GY950_05065, partial [bacterium]|nr:hypothetical protein [bacterium]
MMKNTSLFLMLFLLTFNFFSWCEKGNDFFTLGTEKDTEGLIYPRQVKEGPDGNIYVYDQHDFYIKVYSPTGEFLRKMGGRGEGPGDVK